MDGNLNVKHRRLFSLAAQLKAGKGLTVGATIVEVNIVMIRMRMMIVVLV